MLSESSIHHLSQTGLREVGELRTQLRSPDINRAKQEIREQHEEEDNTMTSPTEAIKQALAQDETQGTLFDEYA